MRPAPLAFGLFVLVALCAIPTSARAESSDDDTEWCVRGEAERLESPRPLNQAVLVLPPAPASSLPSDALLCVRGGLGLDCQVHDPAQSPTPPAPGTYAPPDLASAIVPAVPEPAEARAPLPPGVLGAPRPGFARALERPPRV